MHCSQNERHRRGDWGLDCMVMSKDMWNVLILLVRRPPNKEEMHAGSVYRVRQIICIGFLFFLDLKRYRRFSYGLLSARRKDMENSTSRCWLAS